MLNTPILCDIEQITIIYKFSRNVNWEGKIYFDIHNAWFLF